MASSDSDADIKLRATLDSSEVTTGLQKIGQDASASIDAAAKSGDKLAKSLDDVGKSAKVSAQQLGQMSLAMASMAIDVAGSVAESRGYNKLAGYLKSTAAGAAAGFAATAPLATTGPAGWAAIAGATVLGAGAGAYKENVKQKGIAKSEEQAAADLEAANEKALSSFDQLRGAANESAEFYARLGDESMGAEQRQAALSERIREFGAAAEEIKGKLESDELQRDGKAFAETMREYAQALKQVDQATAAQRALDKVGGKADADGDGRAETLADALTRIGGGVGGAGGMTDLASIQREGIGVAREQLGVLREIKSEGLGTWA